jgi:hypothetical protein
MVDLETVTREQLLERCLAQEQYIRSVDRFLAAKIIEAEPGPDGVMTIRDEDLAPLAVAKATFNERLERIGDR